MMAKKEVMCVSCYKYYVGSFSSRYCPECRSKRWSKLAKERKLHELGTQARRGYTKIRDLDLREGEENGE